MKNTFLFGTTRAALQRPGLCDLRPGRSAVAVLHSVVHQGPTVNQQTTESSFHRRWRLCETPGIYSWHRERRIVFKCWICDGASSQFTRRADMSPGRPLRWRDPPNRQNIARPAHRRFLAFTPLVLQYIVCVMIVSTRTSLLESISFVLYRASWKYQT